LERDLVKSYAFRIIGKLEVELRKFLANDILYIGYGKEWTRGIPSGIVSAVEEKTGVSCYNDPLEFLEETDFIHLKEIVTYKQNYKSCKPFFGSLNMSKFIHYMDEVYKIRNIVSHNKSKFSLTHFDILIDYVSELSRGVEALTVKEFINSQEYRGPISRIQEKCYSDVERVNICNLPPADFETDGGFVGREEDRKRLISLLNNDLDRVITVTGTGGVGKTALALKVAKEVNNDSNSHFTAIIWFSAKETILTPHGIEPIVPEIKGFEGFINQTLSLLRPDDREYFASLDSVHDLAKLLKGYLSANPVLLIIDNVETVIEDFSLVQFIKDVPRKSKVLITSRRGLGEVERRYSIDALKKQEAIRLFRLVSREKRIIHCLTLEETQVERLVNQVQRYPLSIKWALGKAALDGDIEKAFQMPLSGTSDIAKFSFENIFAMLSEKARKCLYVIALLPEDDPPTGRILRYVVDLETETFEKAISQLILTSFIMTHTKTTGNIVKSVYSILSITRGYIHEKLRNHPLLRQEFLERYRQLRLPAEIGRKHLSETAGTQIIAAKTDEELLAVNNVRTAISLYYQGKNSDALEHFKEARNLAPHLAYVLVEFGKYYYREGMETEADKQMQKAADIHPNDPHVWSEWGLMRKNQNRLDESENMFERGLELFPNHRGIHIELGRVKSFQGEFEEAKEFLLTSLNIPGEISSFTRGKILGHIADNYSRWGQAEGYAGRLQNADIYYKQALEIIGDAFEFDPSQRIYDNWIRIHLNYGIFLYKIKKLDTAEFHLEKALNPFEFEEPQFSANPNISAQAYFHLAILERDKEKKNQEKIEEYVQEGIDSSHPNSNIRKKLVFLRKQIESERDRFLQRTPRSNEELIEAESHEFDNVLFWYEWGLVQVASKSYEKARGYFKKGLDINPQHFGLMVELGKCESYLRQFIEADSLLGKCFDIIDPSDPKSRLEIQIEIVNNLRRWAANKSKENMIDEAVELYQDASNRADYLVKEDHSVTTWHLWRQIQLDWGIFLSNLVQIDESDKKLKYSIKQIFAEGREIYPKKGVVATAMHYLALNESMKEEPDFDLCIQYIRKGKTNSHTDSYRQKYLERLEKQIHSKKEAHENQKQPISIQEKKAIVPPIIDLTSIDAIEDVERKIKTIEKLANESSETQHIEEARSEIGALSGYIKFYNNERRFGIIEDDNGLNSYIFFFDDVAYLLQEYQKIDGLNVSFFTEENPKKEGSFIAKEIMILSDKSSKKKFKASWK